MANFNHQTIVDDCDSNSGNMSSTIRGNDTDNTQLMGEQLIAHAGTGREAI